MATYPGAVGMDGSGVVDAVGEGVTSHNVGDRVQLMVPCTSGSEIQNGWKIWEMVFSFYENFLARRIWFLRGVLPRGA